MKKTIIMFVITALSLINISAVAETWEWFPINALDYGRVRCLEYDGNNYLYYANSSNRLWRFDINTKQTELIGKISAGMDIVDMKADSNGNIWIIGYEMNLGDYPNAHYYTYVHKFDGTKITQIDAFEPHKERFLQPSFTKNTDKIYMGSVLGIITITDDGSDFYQLGAYRDDADSIKEKYPYKSIYVNDARNYLYGDYLVWKTISTKDTVCMVNIKDSSDFKLAAVSDYKFNFDWQPTADYVSRFYVVDTNFYIIDEQFPGIAWYNKFLKIKGDSIVKLPVGSFTDEDRFNVDEFIETDEEQICALMIYTKDTDNYDFHLPYESRVLIFDKEHNLIHSYSPPVLPFNLHPEVQGQPYRLSDITKVGDDIYFGVFYLGSGSLCGILKLSYKTDIQDDWAYSFKQNHVWVYDVYPTIVENNSNTLTVNFFCNPKHLEKLNVSISDILGAQTNVDYNVSNFDTYTGIGQMQLTIPNKLSIGTKFIVLQANSDMAVKPVIINK
ncbi:MAG: hypothetical protein LBO69_01950 [Ignavibacteria bacterium]|jgi:hypothetical protein|nr:hypothetical protein [Ignavibacteria bacterium]